MRRVRWLLLVVVVLGAARCDGTPGIPDTPGIPGDPGDPGDPGTPGLTDLVQGSDVEYLGAFRLPGGDERPATFAYGGSAMTFNPDGDASGGGDGFPGSLFVMGHDRLAYGELPDGNQVAEIAIPAPVVSKNAGELNRAAFVQPFADAARGLFSAYSEIPRVGMEYLRTSRHRGEDPPGLGGSISTRTPPEQGPTHAWIDPDLSAPNPQGSWYIGNQSLYSVNGYLFEIPEAWAQAHAGGRASGDGTLPRWPGGRGRGRRCLPTVPGPMMPAHPRPRARISARRRCCSTRIRTTATTSSRGRSPAISTPTSGRGALG